MLRRSIENELVLQIGHRIALSRDSTCSTVICRIVPSSLYGTLTCHAGSIATVALCLQRVSNMVVKLEAIASTGDR